MKITTKIKKLDYCTLFLFPIFLLVVGLIGILKYPDITPLPQEKKDVIQGKLEGFGKYDISEGDQLYLSNIGDALKSSNDLIFSQREIFLYLITIVIALSLIQIFFNIILCIKIKKNTNYKRLI